MTKDARERKRKFEFRTPQKEASPFVFTKKQHRPNDDSTTSAAATIHGTKSKGKATKSASSVATSSSSTHHRHADAKSHSYTTPTHPSSNKSTLPRRVTPVEAQVRKQLASSNDPRKVEIFDALCAVLHKKIQHHVAALHHRKDSTQLLHVLNAAADAIKREFVVQKAAPASTHAHDGTAVHTVVASLESKLQSLLACEEEWKGFHQAVPSTLSTEIAAAKDSFSSPMSPASFDCTAMPKQIAQEQRSLTARVNDVGVKMEFLEASLNEVDRMVDVSHAIRGALFDSFHASEFKGYTHMQTPKEAIKSLMALLS